MHAHEISRFAPPGAEAAQPRLGESADSMVDEDDLFVEDAPFLESGDDQQDDLAAESAGAVPGYGEDDQLLPFPEDELESLVKRRSHRGLALVAILLAVVLAGSVALLLFRSGGADGSPPPIITADGSPTKVTPEDTGADDGDPQSKLVYDRVDSGEGETDTTLLTFDDAIEIEQSGAAEDNAITRVITPGGPGADDASTGIAASGSANGGSATPTTDPDAIQPIGPKRVRTVVVKPDGTIVSSEAAAVDDGAGATATAEMTASEEPSLTEPLAMRTPDDDTAAIAAASGLRSGDELAITTLPEVEAVVGDDAAADAVAVNEPPPEPVSSAPQAPTEAEPTIVATTGGDTGPIDVTPGQPATAAPPETEVAALPPGSFLVQVSSQRSEDSALATYRDLQSRYPAILSAYQPIIQRADLGDRGIYYRVRVGPFSGGDAERLCGDLKDAGGDCILARN